METLWMVLKDNLVDETRSSWSKVTDVTTMSNLVVSNLSVVKTYISVRVHTRRRHPPGWPSSGKGRTHQAIEIQ